MKKSTAKSKNTLNVTSNKTLMQLRKSKGNLDTVKTDESSAFNAFKRTNTRVETLVKSKASKGMFEKINSLNEDISPLKTETANFINKDSSYNNNNNTNISIKPINLDNNNLVDDANISVTANLFYSNRQVTSNNLDNNNNELFNYEDINLDIPEIKPKEESTDNIKVIARFRPINSVERDLIERNMGNVCVKFTKKDGVSVSNSVGFVQSYTLDRIFDSNANQLNLFEEAAKPTIIDILKGYNGTIFTYGQSGSGKTHTMYGSSLYDCELKGIIPRSIECIFDFINHPSNANIKFQIKFSMLEIYKEALYDLLNPESTPKDLKIKETKDKQIYVSNLTELYIDNIEDFLLIIDQADQYRVVSETGLNKQSSRSHLLFIIEVIQQLPDGSEKSGKLNLIDLAGSEKISKTGAQGETLEEAKKINLSLSTLGNVISSLSGDKDYIPYRDSKLTRILQDSLGGNYKTTLIVACSPHVFNSEETNATLKFATRAKKIKNKVKKNIKKSTEELEKIIQDLSNKLSKAKSEIERLKKKILNLPQNVKEEFKLEAKDINDIINEQDYKDSKKVLDTTNIINNNFNVINEEDEDDLSPTIMAKSTNNFSSLKKRNSVFEIQIGSTLEYFNMNKKSNNISKTDKKKLKDIYDLNNFKSNNSNSSIYTNNDVDYKFNDSHVDQVDYDEINDYNKICKSARSLNNNSNKSLSNLNIFKSGYSNDNNNNNQEIVDNSNSITINDTQVSKKKKTAKTKKNKKSNKAKEINLINNNEDSSELNNKSSSLTKKKSKSSKKKDKVKFNININNSDNEDVSVCKSNSSPKNIPTSSSKNNTNYKEIDLKSITERDNEDDIPRASTKNLDKITPDNSNIIEIANSHLIDKKEVNKANTNIEETNNFNNLDDKYIIECNNNNNSKYNHKDSVNSNNYYKDILSKSINENTTNNINSIKNKLYHSPLVRKKERNTTNKDQKPINSSIFKLNLKNIEINNKLQNQEEINYINNKHDSLCSKDLKSKFKKLTDTNIGGNIAYKQLKKQLLEKESELKSIKQERERLYTSNLLLKERSINMKYKLNTQKKLEDLYEKVSLDKVEEVMNKLEQLSTCNLKNFTQIVYPKCNVTDNNNNSNNYLKEENEELKLKLNNVEIENFNMFKKLKIFESESYIDSNITLNSNSKNNNEFDNLQKEYSNLNNIFSKVKFTDKSNILLYNETLKFSKSYFKDCIQFFVNKNDFFNSNIYNSLDPELNNIEKYKQNNVKTSFIK